MQKQASSSQKPPHDDRAAAADARDLAADARDLAADIRETAADRREVESLVRESALDDRERDLDLRSEDVRQRSDLEATLTKRDALLVQMREANGKLVFATLRADELAELAHAAHQAAADNERRFRALATATAAVIWRADPSGKIQIEQDCWAAFAHLDGEHGDDDDPRWRWLRAIPAGDHAAVRDAWTRALTTATPYQCQHRLNTRGGQVWVIARAVPIVVDGVLQEWIGMMTDITDRVRIDEAKEQFIAILGHDLRNPLTAISLGAETFRAMGGPHERLATQMLRSVHRRRP